MEQRVTEVRTVAGAGAAVRDDRSRLRAGDVGLFRAISRSASDADPIRLPDEHPGVSHTGVVLRNVIIRHPHCSVPGTDTAIRAPGTIGGA